MDVTFYILLLLKSLVLLLAKSRQSKAKMPFETQTYFHKMSKHKGKHIDFGIFIFSNTNDIRYICFFVCYLGTNRNEFQCRICVETPLL